jgi:sulfatase modifying factor 1
MKKQFFLTMVMTIGLVGFNQAIAVTYSTDFSTDPGWVTDQPANYYWDAGSQSYHIRAKNLAPGYKPSRYSYKLLDEGVSSFELQWDVNVVSCDWSAGLPFGIYDSQLGDWYGVSDFVEVHPVVADGGRFWAMTLSAGGEYRETSSPYDWSFNKAYTCKIVYDSDLLNVSVQIKNRENQQLIWASNLPVPGTGFNNDLKYLGSSRNGVGDYGYIGFSPYANAEGYIDNVVLSIPEPPCETEMDFVTIGNAGNVADTTGYGIVGYDYRIGKYEVTNAQWNTFVTAAGAPTGNDGGYNYLAYFTDAQQPANMVSWYEAAQFCNYLTSGDKSKGAYQFSGNNANPGDFLGINRTAAQAAYGTIYFLPTEDEWYKAAYFKHDGSGYSLYANGTDIAPIAGVDARYNYVGSPWNIGTGTMEQNGTFDMMGNVWEWNETLIDSYRGTRGGSFAYSPASHLASSYRLPYLPSNEDYNFGFRVASIPEPPIANAGDNIQIASSDQSYTVIQGTATDTDGDLLEYRWLYGEQVFLDWSAVGSNGEAYLDLATLPYFSIGNHTLILEAREDKSCGLSASDEMVLTIENSPPVVQAAPKHQVVEVGIDPIVVVGDAGDFDGDTLLYEWLDDSNNVLASGTVATTPGGEPVTIPDLNVPEGDTRFPVGEHTVRLQVSDGINEPVTDSVSVEVTDTTAPSLSPVPSVTILWPPNHKLIPVTIWANAFDNGGGDIVLSVTVQSSEPADTIGDGNTDVDYYIDSVNNETGVIELRLRSERSGKGSGRVYTITITATDANQNQSNAVVQIRAPHDKSKK